MSLQTTSFAFDCSPNNKDPPGCVLKMTANRYCTAASEAIAGGFSLLFAHCIGSNKEQWEPVIAQVFREQASKPVHQRVHEAWAFDWQNHGDAAVLNRELILSRRGTTGVSPFEWAEAIGAVVRSPQMQGRRLIGIGHSAGAGTMLLSIKETPVPEIPFVAFVLVEPTVATRPLFAKYIARNLPPVVAVTNARRERWSNRQEARAFLTHRPPFRTWDMRALQIYVDSGLEDAQDGSGEVTLKCHRRQEAIAFLDAEPHFAAVEELARVSATVPVHLVWATKSDLVHKRVQESLSDASEGRIAASITHVAGGHMLVQEDPDGIARAICSALDSVGPGALHRKGQL
ncbi:Alpha/beta hydrolase fold-1 [Mycena crocata]|nr:Alpha/beta hydrolase fold-1 [Mycena crocata]